MCEAEITIDGKTRGCEFEDGHDGQHGFFYVEYLKELADKARERMIAGVKPDPSKFFEQGFSNI